MKALICLAGLLIGTYAQSNRPSTLPSYPDRPACSGPSNTTPPVKYRYYCNQYRNMSCSRDYAPTCGWFDQKKVICYDFPCAEDFSNPCVACNNIYIKYVTCERCPPSNLPVTQINYADANTNRLPTCKNSI